MSNAPRYHGYIPGIIVSAVYSDSVTKAGKCSVQLLCQNKLMTQQSVSISKAWIHLRKTDGRAESVIQLMCPSPAYWAEHLGRCTRSPGLLSGRTWWQYHVPSVDWNSFLRRTKPSERQKGEQQLGTHVAKKTAAQSHYYCKAVTLLSNFRQFTSGQSLSMSVRSLDRADRATSFCRCHRVVE